MKTRQKENRIEQKRGGQERRVEKTGEEYSVGESRVEGRRRERKAQHNRERRVENKMILAQKSKENKKQNRTRKNKIKQKKV